LIDRKKKRKFPLTPALSPRRGRRKGEIKSKSMSKIK
jgi:hypothetical protein